MSTEINKDVACPGCGAKVPTRMWSGINAEVNPNLRAQVLDETLFDWKCPHCGYEAKLAYPCLYHDKGGRFMVYFLPKSPDPAKAAGIAGEFPQLRGVRKRITGSLASLKEKILIFEDGLDDRAAELVKLLLAMVLEHAGGGQVREGLYCSVDEAAGRIGFSFRLEGEAEPVRRVTSFAAYRRAAEIVDSLLPPDGGDFLLVDRDFARDLLRRYRGEPAPQPEPPKAEEEAAPEAAPPAPGPEPTPGEPPREEPQAQPAGQEAPAEAPSEEEPPAEEPPEQPEAPERDTTE